MSAILLRSVVSPSALNSVANNRTNSFYYRATACGSMHSAITLSPHLSQYQILVLCLNKLCGRPPQYAPASCKLTFDLLTLKVVSESRVTWPTSVPILVFLGLSVLDFGPMYVTDRQTDRRQTGSSLNVPA